MRGAPYYQMYTKRLKLGIYHTKFGNSLATASAIAGGRLDKVGWIKSHNYRKHFIKYRKPSTLTIGDSITKSLLRYMDVWVCYFGKHTVNLGIGGDKVEDIIWRIRNLDANIRCFNLWNK